MLSGRTLGQMKHGRRSLCAATPDGIAKNLAVNAPDSHNCTTEDAEALDFLAARGNALGIPLGLGERRLILKEVASCKGRMSMQDWERLISRRSTAEAERQTLSEYLSKSHDLHLGQHLLKRTALLGVSFFAMSGSHAAGEAGMHVVGALLVGSITGLGGGTINNMMVGATPVGWMKDPAYLVATIAAGILGFYAWPLVERRWSAGEPQSAAETTGPSELQYGLETVGLGALAVVGAQQGVVRGLNPLISASLGVTVALGGVMRDLMCQRGIRLGGLDGCQSYALSSFSGAAVYVALRQAHVWNCAGSTARLVHGGFPIGLRIVLGMATVVAVRTYAWSHKPAGIFLAMDEAALRNDELLVWLLGPASGETK